MTEICSARVIPVLLKYCNYSTACYYASYFGMKMLKYRDIQVIEIPQHVSASISETDFSGRHNFPAV